jgi:hypothetical protein
MLTSHKLNQWLVRTFYVRGAGFESDAFKRQLLLSIPLSIDSDIIRLREG